jgi:hypothetical protein
MREAERVGIIMHKVWSLSARRHIATQISSCSSASVYASCGNFMMMVPARMRDAPEFQNSQRLSSVHQEGADERERHINIAVMRIRSGELASENAHAKLAPLLSASFPRGVFEFRE